MITIRALTYLKIEIDEEIQGLDQIFSVLQKKGLYEEEIAKKILADEVILRGVAGLLQDYYSGAERIFKKIALEIDERLPKGESWHKALLSQMKAKIPGIRPEAISEKSYEKLDELRSFKHRVGNIYSFNLIPQNVLNNVRLLYKLNESFKRDIEIFLEKMKDSLEKKIKNQSKPRFKL